jgi:hypothetical protein
MATEEKQGRAARTKQPQPALFPVEADTIERMNARIVELEQCVKRLEGTLRGAPGADGG